VIFMHLPDMVLGNSLDGFIIMINRNLGLSPVEYISSCSRMRVMLGYIDGLICRLCKISIV
jgi:hypothetical protein